MSNRIRAVIHQINELNNELEKMRPEFEELWNKLVSSAGFPEFVKMEDVIERILLFHYCEMPGIGPIASIAGEIQKVARDLEDKFDTLFQDSERISALAFKHKHDKASIRPYLRWIFESLLKYLRMFNDNAKFTSTRADQQIYQILGYLHIVTRVHSILRERKILKKLDFQTFDPIGLGQALLLYTFKVKRDTFEDSPELQSHFIVKVRQNWSTGVEMFKLFRCFTDLQLSTSVKKLIPNGVSLPRIYLEISLTVIIKTVTF